MFSSENELGEMMRTTLALAIVLILIGLNGCSKSDHHGVLVNEGFELNLTVTGFGGVPLEGVRALVHVFLPPEAMPGVTKAATTVRFTVPEPSEVTIKVYDMDRNVVATLMHGSLSAGAHEVVFHRDDEGNSLQGTHLYRCEMVASVGGAEVYRGETFMTLYTGVDRDQMPVLGVTDEEGKLTFEDSTEFPFLYNPGPQTKYDENSEARGTYEFIDKVEITLYHPEWDRYLTREVAIGLGSNNIELLWDEKSSVRAIATEASSAVVDRVHRTLSVPPPAPVYSIGPVYPSPFN